MGDKGVNRLNSLIFRNMGADMSTPELEGQLADQLLQLVEKLGTRIKGDTAQGTTKVISELSPWFSLTGNLNIEDWEQVRADLHVAQRERGTKVVPLAIYSLWRLIRDALLSEDVLVKKQLEVLNKTLEKIQKVESVSEPNAQIRFVPQRRASLSANLPKAPQEAQD